jgi:membrane protease YdiL (CAAX protease family)
MGRDETGLWHSLLFVALACALLALGVCYFRPGARRWLLPSQRRRAVPWSAFEVFVALVFVITHFWAAVVDEVLRGLHFFASWYGPDFAAALESKSPDVRAPAQVREMLWLADLSFPLTALSIVLFLRLVSGTRPYQLGLTIHRAGRNFLAGVLAWVSLTPFVYVVLAGATWCTSALCHVRPEEHPLTKLSQSGPLSPLEWFLLVLSAVAAAPVVEELLFRGVLQPWLARRSWGGAAAMVAALLMTLTLRLPGLQTTWGKDGLAGFARELLPVGFVLILVPPFVLIWRWSRSPVPPAVFGTSLFWAMMHANVWPTPVPLFVLGLGLGYLAYRTQSLVAPLVLHALFNGVACVMLLYPSPAPLPVPTPEKGKPVTSAARDPSAVATVTAVPGSWLPRRRYASAIGPSRGDTTDDATSPTSSSPRSTFAPGGTVPSPCTFRPSSVRLMWPRSRAMTIGSWPR